MSLSDFSSKYSISDMISPPQVKYILAVIIISDFATKSLKSSKPKLNTPYLKISMNKTIYRIKASRIDGTNILWEQGLFCFHHSSVFRHEIVNKIISFEVKTKENCLMNHSSMIGRADAIVGMFSEDKKRFEIPLETRSKKKAGVIAFTCQINYIEGFPDQHPTRNSNRMGLLTTGHNNSDHQKKKTTKCESTTRRTCSESSFSASVPRNVEMLQPHNITMPSCFSFDDESSSSDSFFMFHNANNSGSTDESSSRSNKNEEQQFVHNKTPSLV